MKNNFHKIIGLQIALTVIVYFVLPKDSLHQPVRYLFYGFLISSLQFGLLYFIWWRVFTKKKIAPSVIAVVIKYALLGFAFWSVYPLSQSETNALILGILTNPGAIILFALTKSSDNKSR